MSKNSLKEKQKRWDELFEERQLKNVIRKRSSQRTEEQNKNFFLESRFQLMAESLEKMKFDSSEFNAVLDECVDLFLEMHSEVKEQDRDLILKMTKDRIFKKMIIGEFDGKAVPKQSKDDSWPKSGFMPLREAIKKRDIGQNPSAKEPEIVKKVFGGEAKPDSYPSPSSSKAPKD